MLAPLLLFAALAVPVPAAEGPVAPPTPQGRAAREQPDDPPGAPPAEEAPPATGDGRLRRALDLLAGGEAGRARLVEEAASGAPGVRRAALEALATLATGETPPGTLEAGLDALGSGDPLLRRAGVRALLACGPGAADAVGARLARVLAAPHGRGPAFAAAVGFARRLRDALADLRRADVERDFLGLWSSDDGTFRGMYESLRRHGAFGARVLTAVALDRRMAAGDVLGYGPYAWLHAAAGERERNDCRFRALEAVADAGDAASREMLRTSLRERPAKELYDETDTDPIPAALDDALREAIAALGDPVPLVEMIVASAEAPHGVWDETVELRRRAGARAALAAADPAVRMEYLLEAEHDLRKSLETKRSFGIPIDGVEYYNLACLLARRDAPRDVGGIRDREAGGEKEWLLSDRAVALKYLRRSLRTYSVSSAWMEKDGDLRSLRGEPEFKAIVAELRAREKALERGLPPK